MANQSYNLVYNSISRLTCKSSAGLFHTFFVLFYPIKKQNLEADKSQTDAVNKSNGAPTVLHMHSWPVHPHQQSLWYNHLGVIPLHIYQKPDPADWAAKSASKDPYSAPKADTSIIKSSLDFNFRQWGKMWGIPGSVQLCLGYFQVLKSPLSHRDQAAHWLNVERPSPSLKSYCGWAQKQDP